MQDNIITPQNLWAMMLKYKHLLGYQYGFTIPFLIGTYKKRGFLNDVDLTSSSCIKYVLEMVLRFSSTENPVKIFECDTLSNELVFQYLSTRVAPFYVQHLKDYHPNIMGKIYWNKKNAEITNNNLDSLVEFLWNKPAKRGDKTYGDLISNGEFSCEFGVWKDYSPHEKKFIDNIHILEAITNLNNL